MLYIITGEDTASSRKKLSELLEGFEDTIRLDGKKSTVGEIEMALTSGGLFSEKKSVVIENFTKAKPFEALVEHALKYVKDLTTNVILWDEAELTTKQKNAFKGIV